MTAEQAQGQSEMWLELLQALTHRRPDWLVMKNVESALHGTGDVDSIAPIDAWLTIVDTFRSWAHANGLGPVVACRHAPFLLHLIALSDRRPEFFELDVNRRKIFLGSTLFRPQDVAPMAVMDPRGFRILRPGVDALLKLVQNGMFRDGRPNVEGLRAKGVRDLLISDPIGVREGAELFGPAKRAVVRAADAVAEGGWDRRALLTMEAWSILRGVREPDAAVARIRFRWQKDRCPLLVSVFKHGRRPWADREGWLRRVEQNHSFYP